MALPFLRGETEENATQTLAFVSIVIVTLGLAVFNVCGAIAGSQSDNALEIVIRGAFGLVITGAEFLAAVALVRVMLAKNTLRKVVGTIIFIGLAWVCIQNGKRAAHLIFPEFAESAVLLEEKAKIQKAEADKEDQASSAAVAAIPAMLAGVQGDIAEAERKQRLLGAQSPEKIAEMQQMLITHGYYFFQVDGRMGPETERGMRSMGEDLRNELEGLRSREAQLIAGMTTVQSAQPIEGGETALTAAGQAAVYEDRARQNRRAQIWIEIMLWVVEGARSFGLWALVTTITAKDQKDPVRVAAGKKSAETKKRRKRRTEKIEEQAESYLKRWRHAVKLAKNTKYTSKGIAETAFKQGDMEHAITIMKRAGLITDEEIRLVKRSDENLPVITNPNAVDVIDPNPSTTNGSGHPPTEGDTDDADDYGTSGAVSSN